MTRSILPGFNMDLLLNTHAVVWYITEDSRLPMFLRRQIEDSTNNCYVNIASLWEMASMPSESLHFMKSSVLY